MLSKACFLLLIEKPVNHTASWACRPSPLDDMLSQAVVEVVHLIVDFVSSIDPVVEDPLREDLEEWEDIYWRSSPECIDPSPYLQELLDFPDVRGINSRGTYAVD